MALVGIGDHQLDAAQTTPTSLRAVQKVSASEGPISIPSTSRRPSLLTPTVGRRFGQSDGHDRHLQKPSQPVVLEIDEKVKAFPSAALHHYQGPDRHLCQLNANAALLD
jgi:hypothetical protein